VYAPGIDRSSTAHHLPERSNTMRPIGVAMWTFRAGPGGRCAAGFGAALAVCPLRAAIITEGEIYG
jgi:hypothetical protein